MIVDVAAFGVGGPCRASIRAVVDTSILVRAVLKPQGSVGPVVRSLREGRYVYLYSEATLNELIDVLSRPRLVRRYGVTADEAERLCSLLILRGERILRSPRREG